MQACTCPIPDPPDVLGQVIELQQAELETERARRIEAVSKLMAYAEVSAHMPLALRATLKQLFDEAYQAFFPPRRRQRQPGTGAYPNAAAFLSDVTPIVQHLYRQRNHPSADKVADALPRKTSGRQLQRVVWKLFDLTWNEFVEKLR